MKTLCYFAPIIPPKLTRIALFTNTFLKIKDVCHSKPIKLENAQEGQGEAVAYNYFDDGVIHISEGYKPYLFKIGCL